MNKLNKFLDQGHLFQSALYLSRNENEYTMAKVLLFMSKKRAEKRRLISIASINEDLYEYCNDDAGKDFNLTTITKLTGCF